MAPAPITVFFATDEVMAMPLSVTIASIIAHRSSGRAIHMHVLACGVRRATRERVWATLNKGSDDDGVMLTWHDITRADTARLAALYVRSDRPYPPAAYARLLAAEYLPDTVERAIYLDADTMARCPLDPLWEAPFEDAALLVVADIPSKGQIPRLKGLLRATDRARFGLNAASRYFQSGVMVFDMNVLRREGTTALMEMLDRYPELTFPDQDALNIVFANRCRFIDPRWNQMTAVYWDEVESDPPYPQAAFDALRDDPWIVHFSGRPKPWESNSTHPFAAQWQEHFATTPWAGLGDGAGQRLRVLWPKLKRRLAKALRRGRRV